MATLRVSGVGEVHYAVNETDRTGIVDLVIMVNGYVPTSGWRSPTLVPWIYAETPGDGILDLDFVAERPEGLLCPEIGNVSADIEFANIDISNFWGEDKPLRGVLVHAAGRNATLMFDASKPRKTVSAWPA
jgi:hypothetical protein